MQLSKRLQAVADLVTPGSRVADVGCDHAYTSIYLALNNRSPHIIAMDINQGPIERAAENVEKYGCCDRIETRRSDGLQRLEVGEADTILIGGMGGALTMQILMERKELLTTVRELVLQPQSEVYKVRQLLKEQDFIIIAENMIKEDGKFYVMMKAVPAAKAVTDTQTNVLSEEEHFYYGRILLEQKHPVLKEYLLWDLRLCEDIRKALAVGKSDTTSSREIEIREKIRLINRGLGYY